MLLFLPASIPPSFGGLILVKRVQRKCSTHQCGTEISRGVLGWWGVCVCGGGRQHQPLREMGSVGKSLSRTSFTQGNQGIVQRPMNEISEQSVTPIYPWGNEAMKHKSAWKIQQCSRTVTKQEKDPDFCHPPFLFLHI